MIGQTGKAPRFKFFTRCAMTIAVVAFAVVFTAVFTAASVYAQNGEQSIAIQNVTVIDGISADARPALTVVTRGDRITAIGPAAEVAIPDGAAVIDGTGKFLIPGLWDTHAHLTYWGEDALDMLVQAGVTSIRELGGDMEIVGKWKTEVEAGTRLGPSMVWCGPYLEGPDAPDEYRLKVSTAAEARKAVQDLRNQGVDFIKIQAVISPELVSALVDQAAEFDMKVVGHVPQGITAEEASDLGLRSVEHLNPYMRLTEEQLEATFAAFKRNDTWMSPALYSLVAGVVDRGEDPETNDSVQRAYAIVRRAHESGVNLLIGANFAYRNWPQQPGSGLHGEMHSMVDAGIPAMDVLQLATSKAAAFNGRADVSGAIKVGLTADLVLLDADPLQDIRNTERINTVILRGRQVGRSGTSN
jgi:imidazolonepropionase-like amidohydrolase